jgi:hypothetical protein
MFNRTHMISALLVLSSLIIAIIALVFSYDAVMIGEMFIAGAGGLMGPCFFLWPTIRSQPDTLR